MITPESQSSKTRRVFFALWPDRDVRQQISQALHHSSYQNFAKGRTYRDHNLHITLHFLGNISEDQLVCVKQQAQSIASRSFTLSISHFGRFKRAGVLWLAPESIPESLVQLHRNLGNGLAYCDFEQDRRDYRPHITLMRKFHEKIIESNIEPIIWNVNSFVLVESVAEEGGVRYIPIETYALG